MKKISRSCGLATCLVVILVLVSIHWRSRSWNTATQFEEENGKTKKRQQQVENFANFQTAVADFPKLNFHITNRDGQIANLFVEPTSVQTSIIAKLDTKKFESENVITVVIVACGHERILETVNLVKSIILFTSSSVNFIFFTESEEKKFFRDQILLLKNSGFDEISANFIFRVVEFPTKTDKKSWKNLFRTCASQRLFLPSVLADVDAVIYLDTDVLFLAPVEELWRYFTNMTHRQLAALAPEHEEFSIGWYNRFAQHPFVKPLGVNSGVMLMNLTRMRAFGWEDVVAPVFEQYKSVLTWGDQDIINIIFHFHEDRLMILPCAWNFRPDHCIYMSACRSAADTGVRLVHGNRRSFQPATPARHRSATETSFFRTIFNVVRASDKHTGFHTLLESALRDAEDDSACRTFHEALLKSIRTSEIG